MALSGGGIRAAAFSLGVLQALSKADLLKRFDYMSTVSGGGYIGSSLTWWLSGRWRSRDMELDHLPEQSRPWNFGLDANSFPYGVGGVTSFDPASQPRNAREAGPRLLNYLRWQGNYLTPGGGINAWSAIAVVVRSIFLNLFILIPLITFVLVFLYWLPRILFPQSNCPYEISFGACLSRILSHDFRALFAEGSVPVMPMPGPLDTAAAGIFVIFVQTLMIAVAFANFWFIYYTCRQIWKRRHANGIGAAWWAWLVAICAISVAILLYAPPELPPNFQKYWLLILATIIAVVFGILCVIYSFLTYIMAKLSVLPESAASFVIRAIARAGLGFGYMTRRLLECWAGVYFSVFVALLLIGSLPLIAEWLTSPTVSPAGTALALLGTLTAAVAALLRGGATVEAFLRARGWQLSGGISTTLAAALLLFGVLIVSYHASVAILTAAISPIVALAVLVVALTSALLVNVNQISLGQFYRDRLLEAFMPGYDAVIEGRTDAAPQAAEQMRLAEGSTAAAYHIVNTNVVLINANDRRRRSRGGDSFILTRDYCGSNATGWRRTDKFIAGRMTVPDAMAISGATARPDTWVGSTRSSVLVDLILRFGHWVPHPIRGNRNAIPNHFRSGLWALIAGFTEDYRFQQLTHGGNFDNLGIYELIRRRLRLILVCDAGADPYYPFEDLGVARRLIEQDFGARIEFRENYKIEDLTPRSASFGVASIYYPSSLDPRGEPLPDAQPAWLIYLKGMIVHDLRGSKGGDPAVPDQPTADQFSREDQFEAYRQLGAPSGRRDDQGVASRPGLAQGRVSWGDRRS